MVKETKFDYVFDSQKEFRVLLDAFSRPGSIQTFSDYALNPPLHFGKANAIIALTIFDINTSFSAEICFQDQTESYIQVNTNSIISGAASADYVFVNGKIDVAEIIKNVRKADLLFPENNSTIIMLVDEILTDESNGYDCQLQLIGPGIKTEQNVFFNGIVKRNIETIQFLNSEFPLGIDLIITDTLLHVCAIPRSAMIQIIN